MGIPTSREKGYQWLIEEKNLQLIKLGRKSKVPARSEKGWAERTEKRPFKDIGLTRSDNAGVLTGRISGIIVLDIDNDKLFPPEYEIPDTFTVRTKNGYHHYFSLPDDSKRYGNKAIKPSGFDLRGEGGHVVAPWSTHPDGGRYVLIADKPFAEAPEWLLTLSESSASSSATRSRKVPIVSSISEPEGFRLPAIRKESIEEPTPKGKRSEKVWAVLNTLVELDCPTEDIVYIFESYPDGIGAKYHEKGGGRVSWLTGQIDKIRKEIGERYCDVVKATDQLSVDRLVNDILKSFKRYDLSVSVHHKQTIRDFVNLLIGMVEGSVTGWYAMPIPVGGGKTQTLLHFIKFLYETGAHFPISVAFEKIQEIETAIAWLKENGVSSDYYQAVHSDVEGIKEIIPTLSTFPVLLHTHERLKGGSYMEDYFRFGEEMRKLLIYDESMLNALIHSASTADVSIEITRFTREYEVNEEFRIDIQEDVFQFFKLFNTTLDKLEKTFRAGSKKEIPLNPDVSMLSEYDHFDLIKYGRIIEANLGDTDLFRDILSTSITPEEFRKLSLVKDGKAPAILVSKELLDERIENLITTDASREFRRLFRYTQRTDGKKVQVYNTPNFRWDDELGVWCIPLNSGRDSIRKAFNDDPKNNEYLQEIVNVVEKHNGFYEQDSKYGHTDKAKYLFFYPKVLTTIPALVELKLIKSGLMEPSESDGRLFFANFGRETATNEFKDCEVIVFIGLNHKPKHTIKALLAGEGYLKDPTAIMKDVEAGEFLHQLQQGIGRGTIRKGHKQFVYFFHNDPDCFKDDLQKAFPLSYYNGESLEPDQEEVPDDVEVTDFGW